MSKQLKPFAELLQSTLSAEERKEHKENYSNEKLGTFEQIPYTPFWVTGDPEKGYAGIMGNFKITEIFETKEEVIELVNAQPYELLITIMSCVFEVLDEMKSKPIEDTLKEPMIRKQPKLFTNEDGPIKEEYPVNAVEDEKKLNK